MSRLEPETVSAEAGSDPSHDPAETAEWFASPLGQYLLSREQTYYDRAVVDVFGYNAVQVGLPAVDLLRSSRIPFRCHIDVTGSVAIRADASDLPLATGSIDLVVLPHVLEFHRNPHQILREVSRVLMAEGNVVISGFNPWSLWGGRRLFAHNGDYPWRGRFINLPRLKDWLALLGLEIVAGQMDGYVPPCTQQKWLDRFGFMESAGNRWWPIAGGVYFVQAVKRVRGMRLILPKWRDRLAPGKALAPVPEKGVEAKEPMAARGGRATQ